MSTISEKNHSNHTFHSPKKLSTKQQLDILHLIFDHIDNGACVVDANGFITHFNSPYGTFLGVNPKEQIGKHVTEVVENTRLHIVAKTGKTEVSASQPINGQEMIVQRIPVMENGRVIAVYGQVMFKDIKDINTLAAKLSDLRSRVKRYEKELSSLRSTRYTFDSIIGHSQAIEDLKKEANRATKCLLPVLITGESGTGKELFAQAIHSGSRRQNRPFIRVNCAAIPKDLLEAELFGYDRGAFTGAKSSGKKGKFELADQGTIFLDEIGDLPLEMQPKLLRVLEEREFERIGSNKVIRADFRLVAASNQKLKEMVDAGTFRADLYYRLNVIPIEIPPLRERREDIVLLSHHLLEKSLEGSGQQVNLSSGAEKLLSNHDWPGNVRELSNVVERTLASIDGSEINPSDLPFYLNKGEKIIETAEGSLLKEVVAKAEKAAISDALKLTGYNKVKAAKILGIHRTLLYKKAQKYSIPLTGG
ncbi:sigma-54 interaction domain-containing protein [Desulforhopalus sp. 52FAK]